MFRPRRSSALCLALATSLAFLPLAAEAAASPPTGSPAQVATIQDCRNVGTAMFHWYQDQMKSHPKAAKHDVQPEPSTAQLSSIPVISRQDLAKVLVPKYIAEIPAADGWGHPYEFRLATQALDGEHVMAVRSGGGDGRFSGETYTIGAFRAGDENEDIAWMDGYFVRWPQAPERAKKSVQDTRNVGTAMYRWFQDQVKDHPQGSGKPEGSEIKAVEMSWIPVISREDLAKILVPKYIADVPATDGWGNPYEYRLETKSLDARRIMAIRSSGADGKFSGDSYAVGPFSPADEAQDLVWMDGYFVRWPQVGVE